MNNTAKCNSHKFNNSHAATNQFDQQHPSISLFVYGTLKRGFANHNRLCRNAIDICPAFTWGRLYQLPAGYPALEIPESSILAHGTADPLADAGTQARIDDKVTSRLAKPFPPGEWNLIHGELITLADPVRALPPIDFFEGFSPFGHCLYTRRLTLVFTGGSRIPGWIYTMRGECLLNAICLPDGVWPAIDGRDATTPSQPGKR